YCRQSCDPISPYSSTAFSTAPPPTTSGCSGNSISSRETPPARSLAGDRPLRGRRRPRPLGRLPLPLDALHVRQAIERGVRLPPDPRPPPPHSRQLRAPAHRDELRDLLREQPHGVVRHGRADARRVRGGRLRPHALPLPGTGDDRGAHPAHLHVRADHGHHPLLHPREAARAREHASGAGPLVHDVLSAVLPVAPPRVLPERPPRTRGGGARGRRSPRP